MAREQSILEFILRSRKEGRGDEETERGLKKLESAFNAVRSAAAIGAVVAGAKFAAQMNDLGLEVRRAEQALLGYTGSTQAAADALDAVERAGGGALDRLTAGQNAARLFAMGLADSADQAAELTEIAITLGAAMGRGPQQAFEEFTLLLSNQSIQRLDTFGISSGQVRERIAELAEEMPNATREALFMQATLEDARAKLKELEAAGFEAVASTDQLKSSFSTLKQTLAVAISEGIEPAAEAILRLMFWHRDIKQALDQHIDSVLYSSDTYEEYVAEVIRAANAAGKHAQSAEELRGYLEQGSVTLEGYNNAIKYESEVYWEAMRASQDLATVTDELKGAQYAAWTSTQTLADGLEETEQKEWRLTEEHYRQRAALLGLTYNAINPAADAIRAMGDAASGAQDPLANLDLGAKSAIDRLQDEIKFLESGGPQITAALQAVRDAVAEGLPTDVASGFLEQIEFAELARQVDVGDLTIDQATQQAVDEYGLEWDEAAAKIQGAKEKIDNLPEEVKTEIEILVNTRFTGGPGYQHGGSFVVPGHGLGDRPYVLNLEPGEIVNVIPRLEANTQSIDRSVMRGGTININTRRDERWLLDTLERISLA